MAKQKLCELGARNINVIQYPSVAYGEIDKLKKKIGYKIENRIVISLIGMIRRDKNYEMAFNGFSKSICFNNDDYLLLIAGYPSGVDSGYVQSLVECYGIENVFVLQKYLSLDELNDMFNLSDYMLIPYGGGGSSQSGPASTAREYEIPCIAFRGGEISDYIEKYNIGYTFTGISELVSILDGLPGESVFNFEEVRGNFSWEQTAQQYINLVEVVNVD